MKPLIIILTILAILAIILMYNKSTFGGLYTDTYASEGCEKNDRTFPSGHVPGSWLGMTTAEKNNLTNFIKNSSTI